MEIALIVFIAIGILLFLIGYFSFVREGFKHHFITGLISSLPVLNIITVPVLWYKSGRKIILSIIGLLLIGGSWMLGADKSIHHLLQRINGNPPQETVLIQPNKQKNLAPLALPNSSDQHVIEPPNITPKPSLPDNNNQGFFDNKETQSLPPKALYRMGFEAIPVNQINTLQNRVIRLTTQDNRVYEGRVKQVTASSLSIQKGRLAENEFPIATIKSVEIMVKKPIQ